MMPAGHSRPQGDNGNCIDDGTDIIPENSGSSSNNKNIKRTQLQRLLALSFDSQQQHQQQQTSSSLEAEYRAFVHGSRLPLLIMAPVLALAMVLVAAVDPVEAPRATYALVVCGVPFVGCCALALADAARKRRSGGSSGTSGTTENGTDDDGNATKVIGNREDVPPNGTTTLFFAQLQELLCLIVVYGWVPASAYWGSRSIALCLERGEKIPTQCRDQAIFDGGTYSLITLILPTSTSYAFLLPIYAVVVLVSVLNVADDLSSTDKGVIAFRMIALASGHTMLQVTRQGWYRQLFLEHNRAEHNSRLLANTVDRMKAVVNSSLPRSVIRQLLLTKDAAPPPPPPPQKKTKSAAALAAISAATGMTSTRRRRSSGGGSAAPAPPPGGGGEINPSNVASVERMVTAVFTDVVQFTSWARDRPSHEVVKMVSVMFHAFDELAQQYGVTKVKTVGDGYWAVCGLPDEELDSKMHAIRGCYFAKQLPKVMTEINRFYPSFGGDLQIRVGVGSGNGCGALLPSNTLSYEVFGECCTVAQLAEQSAEPGTVWISEPTFQLASETIVANPATLSFALPQQFYVLEQLLEEVESVVPSYANSITEACLQIDNNNFTDDDGALELLDQLFITSLNTSGSVSNATTIEGVGNALSHSLEDSLSSSSSSMTGEGEVAGKSSSPSLPHTTTIAHENVDTSESSPAPHHHQQRVRDVSFSPPPATTDKSGNNNSNNTQHHHSKRHFSIRSPSKSETGGSNNSTGGGEQEEKEPSTMEAMAALGSYTADDLADHPGNGRCGWMIAGNSFMNEEAEADLRGHFALVTRLPLYYASTITTILVIGAGVLDMLFTDSTRLTGNPKLLPVACAIFLVAMGINVGLIILHLRAANAKWHGDGYAAAKVAATHFWLTVLTFVLMCWGAVAAYSVKVRPTNLHLFVVAAGMLLVRPLNVPSPLAVIILVGSTAIAAALIQVDPTTTIVVAIETSIYVPIIIHIEERRLREHFRVHSQSLRIEALVSKEHETHEKLLQRLLPSFVIQSVIAALNGEAPTSSHSDEGDGVEMESNPLTNNELLGLHNNLGRRFTAGVQPRYHANLEHAVVCFVHCRPTAAATNNTSVLGGGASSSSGAVVERDATFAAQRTIDKLLSRSRRRNRVSAPSSLVKIKIVGDVCLIGGNLEQGLLSGVPEVLDEVLIFALRLVRGDYNVMNVDADVTTTAAEVVAVSDGDSGDNKSPHPKMRKAKKKRRDNRTHRPQLNKIPFYSRVGIHVGPVTCGVLGTTRLCFDIFGSTVNVASRIMTTAAWSSVVLHENARHRLESCNNNSSNSNNDSRNVKNAIPAVVDLATVCYEEADANSPTPVDAKGIGKIPTFTVTSHSYAH